MKPIPVCLLTLIMVFTHASGPAAEHQQVTGIASWYGDELRGRLMANGKPFNPDHLTAASWFYPLGTRLRVTLNEPTARSRSRSVLVTITDRGPARRLVNQGRIIDLAVAAFDQLADRDRGLIRVIVEVQNQHPENSQGHRP